MPLAVYTLWLFGSGCGIVEIIIGLGFGIKARLKLTEPVDKILDIISVDFLWTGVVTIWIFLLLALLLAKIILP